MRFRVLHLSQLVFTHLDFNCFLSCTSLINSEVMHFSCMIFSHSVVLCAKRFCVLLPHLYLFAFIIHTQNNPPPHTHIYMYYSEGEYFVSCMHLKYPFCSFQCVYDVLECRNNLNFHLQNVTLFYLLVCAALS